MDVRAELLASVADRARCNRERETLIRERHRRGDGNFCAWKVAPAGNLPVRADSGAPSPSPARAMGSAASDAIKPRQP